MAAGDRADLMHLLDASCVTGLVQVGDQGVLRGESGNRADRGKACFRVDAPVAAAAPAVAGQEGGARNCTPYIGLAIPWPARSWFVAGLGLVPHLVAAHGVLSIPPWIVACRPRGARGYRILLSLDEDARNMQRSNRCPKMDSSMITRR